MKKIVTHNGTFHADDVFAMAALQLYFGNEELEVVRTRDEAIIEVADWVFDVGGVYDPERLRFDHHQPGAPVRDSGIPYAAFGLVWQQVGERVSGSKEVADIVNESIVLPIDANDNGVSLYELSAYEVSPLEVSSVIQKFNPVWGSEEEYDKNFFQAVTFAKEVLCRFIKHGQAKVKMNAVVGGVYQNTEDKRVLIFDQPVSTKLCIQYPEVQVAVLPDDPKVSVNWSAVAIRKEETGFETRVSFPAEWSGLRNEELAAVSGIKGSVFCHRNRFLFVSDSKEGALAAAEKVLC